MTKARSIARKHGSGWQVNLSTGRALGGGAVGASVLFEVYGGCVPWVAGKATASSVIIKLLTRNPVISSFGLFVLAPVSCKMRNKGVVETRIEKSAYLGGAATV